MATGRAINARFNESQSGYTRATGPDFSFQVDPIRRQQTTSEAVLKDLNPNVMHLDTEYNDKYCGPSGLVRDSTIKKCFTNPYTGRPCGNQMLSTGKIYNAENFPHVYKETRGDTQGMTAADDLNGSTGMQGAPRVLVPGSQPGTNEGTRALYNTDTQKVHTFNPDASFGQRTGAAFPATGSGRLDGLQSMGNLGSSISRLSATQPGLAASLRASQGIIPGSVGDIAQMKQQGVVGVGSRQFPEWHAPECDQQEYYMNQTMTHGPCSQKCTNREIIPGSQPGSNEGTRAICGMDSTGTIQFNQTGISAIGGTKQLYNTNGARQMDATYGNATLMGTAMPRAAEDQGQMDASYLNSTATVPELPAIKSPITSDSGKKQAEIQAALRYGQQMENGDATNASDASVSDMLQAVTDTARGVVGANKVYQVPPQQRQQESSQEHAYRVAHEAVTRPQVNPNAIVGTASSAAVAHDNTYSSVRNPTPDYDTGRPVDNVNVGLFNRVKTPAAVTTTSRPNSIPGITRSVELSNAAVASSGSINERGFNEPPQPQAAENVYANVATSQQLYQPSAPAYNPSHSYSAFANNPVFPSTSRCCERTTNGCVPSGGCQCGLASSKTRWDAANSMGITETGVEYIKPPHTTFCDAPVARNFLRTQRHQQAFTRSTGAYTNMAEMAASGFCDKQLCQTTQISSNGNGGASYKTLNAYIPAYSAYRRPWPGNYNEKYAGTVDGEPHKVTDESSKESGFIENCKFDTKPFTFIPGERPIGLTETFAREAGNTVGGGGNAPDSPNEFLTTHNDHFRAIYEPQYGKLHQNKNDGVVPSSDTNTDGTFNGLLSTNKIRANVPFKPGCGPIAGNTTGPRRCTCYDKVNNVWM